MHKKLFLSILIFFIFTVCLFADSITISVDSESKYAPTQIVNGSFDDYPWMTYTWSGNTYTSWVTSLWTMNDLYSGYTNEVTNKVFNGVGKGWNTTETHPFRGSLFEYIGYLGSQTYFTNTLNKTDYNHNDYIYKDSAYSVNGGKKYVELNCSNPATLYQDLTTTGGDVIKWSLGHATVSAADDTQSMRVEIGAPKMNGTSIVNASGLTTSTIDTAIQSSTLAVYRNTGVTNAVSNGKTSDIGFAGSDIANLSLNKNSQGTKWYTASGIYVVPDNQTVTRFAFVSEASTPTKGNLLDDVTFSTLIGNLSAAQNSDGTITIRGYWGDSDSSNKLCIKFNTDTVATITMSSVLNKNFEITIPEDNIPENATSVDVYHEDYESAKRTIKIVTGYDILMYVGNNADRSSAEDTLDWPMIALEDYWESLESLNGEDCKINVKHVRVQDELKNLDKLMSYSLIIVSFPDDFGTNNSDIATIADNLLAYTNAGGCLVMFGETNSVKTWKNGNINLSALAKQMGITASYGDDVPGSSAGGRMTVNTNADLCKVDGRTVNNLYGYYIPSVIVGSGSNTANNTQIVATYTGSDSVVYNAITDTKVGNGYITFLTDINMWMGKVWAGFKVLPESYYDTSNNTYPVSDFDTKNFLQNLLSRSIENIEAVSEMNKITYYGLEDSNYAFDGDGNELSNPTRYSSDTDSFTLNNPLKTGYEFAGWGGTGINGLSRSVTVAKGSSGDRSYTAYWHKHEFVYSVKDSRIKAFCTSDDQYADVCLCHDEEHAVRLYVAAGGNVRLDPDFSPADATTKGLTWTSSDISIAKADNSNWVHALKEGSSVITGLATDGSGKSTSVVITVTP